MTGQGELQIRLSVDNLTEITLLRPPQEDMTVSFASNLISTSKARMLNEAIYSIGKSPSTRTYIFTRLRGQVIRYSQKDIIFSLTAPQTCILFKPQQLGSLYYTKGTSSSHSASLSLLTLVKGTLRISPSRGDVWLCRCINVGRQASHGSRSSSETR